VILDESLILPRVERAKEVLGLVAAPERINA
jgi:hypothetical protein